MAGERSLFDQFRELTGQFVRVELQDKTSTSGVLFCIDPETDHVALLFQQDAPNYTVKIVLAHHVRDLEKESLENSGDQPTLAALQESLRQGSDVLNQEDPASLQRRREQLGQLLDKNFVPFEVTADGSFCVFGGAATLREPFRTVECANEQLLRRLQQLLAQLEIKGQRRCRWN